MTRHALEWATFRVTHVTDRGPRTLKPQVGMPMISPLARHDSAIAQDCPPNGEDA